MALRRYCLQAVARFTAARNGIVGENCSRYGQLRVLSANSSMFSPPVQSYLPWSRLESRRSASRAVQAVQVPAPWREFPASGQVFQEEAQIGPKTVTFETGKLARFAAGAVVVSIKDTKVLATVVSDYSQKEGMEFLPLQVEYREKQYAQGKIPSTFMRREGMPNERELLCGRVIDRSIRPLFPKGFFFETQVIANVLCCDGDQDPDVLSVNAASAALTISNIPWHGPIGAVRIGRVNGTLIVNPNVDEVSQSDLNLIYACTATNALMIETQAAEITNNDYAAALHLAHSEAIKLIEPQLRLAAKVKNEKRPVSLLTVPDSVLEKIRKIAEEPIRSVMENPLFGKFERGKALTTVQDSVGDLLKSEGEEDSIQMLGKAFDAVKKDVVRGNVLAKGQRVDGRALTEVRELYCEAGLHPALHGSSLFSRGNTQVLCTVTMGAPDDAQRLESVVGPDTKRFMVHYSFPPFSVNEVGRLGGLNRREVGHGTLAEKALLSLLPSDEEFPYSIRVTSEVLASDGSSSMATVCGGSLALMDAGVPLREHAAGVSVGLVTVTDKVTGEVKDYKLLTDILGLEDHLGDMDFKIAGTRRGITAVQLDMKLPGIPLPILIEALEPALIGRTFIIDTMEQTIVKPREDLRDNTPRRGQMTILRESIGRLIGPQGTTIRNIQRMTGAKLNVSDEGILTIFARDQACYDQTKEMVEACIGREVEVGGSYFATVVAIKDFGAFVELEGGLQGMVHISEISHNKIQSIGDVLMLGQQLKVICIGRDIRGNMKLSRKAAMTPEEESASVTVQSSTVSKILDKSASVGNQIRSPLTAVSDGFLKQATDQHARTSTRVEEVGVNSTSTFGSDVSRGSVTQVSTRTSSMESAVTSPPSSSRTNGESHKRRRVSPSSPSDSASVEETSSSPRFGPLRPRRQGVRKGKTEEPSSNFQNGLE
ncbi:hypothetical protein R1flu_024559 [Riccia fluitans]|uniref:Polyribonucleotide nucleotidyltransferase 2, mitochondrial n=1 Tax=Riccia fluitans TaxID=41844 RepID=A0ABD1XVE3_9MARC